MGSKFVVQAVADIAVIGAGIIGTTIAERLQHEGKQVLLIDKQSPGEGCSKGNAGHFASDIILPLANFNTLLSVPRLLLDPLGPLSIRWSYLPQLLPWLMRFTWAAMPHKSQRTIHALKQLNRPSIRRFEELLQRTELTSLMSRQGALTVFQSMSGAQKNKQHAILVKQHGVKVEQLSGEQIRELEPALDPSIIGGLYYPETAHTVDPFLLVTSLFDKFLINSGSFIQQEVTAIETRNESSVRLKTDSGEIFAKEVVIACGAWSKHLAQTVGHRVPLETERGYHLMLPTPEVNITRPITSFERSFVMTPMTEGLRLAGTVELAGLKAPANYQRATTLFNHAQGILPGINNHNASSWMGHRPSLPDSLPVIGRSPINQKVIFAFGHQHLGLTQAAVTADLISEITHQQSTHLDISAFSIERF